MRGSTKAGWDVPGCGLLCERLCSGTQQVTPLTVNPLLLCHVWLHAGSSLSEAIVTAGPSSRLFCPHGMLAARMGILLLRTRSECRWQNCVCRTADFMRTVTDAEDDLQLFWQAFPAEGGAARTTYMFSYADCAKQRPSLQVLAANLHSMQPSA